jgi:transposase InsO family protein
MQQYTPAAYAALAEDCQVTLSVGRTGQCRDNALAFFSSLKAELIDTRAWPTRAGARRAVVEYIAWSTAPGCIPHSDIAAPPNSKTTTAKTSDK